MAEASSRSTVRKQAFYLVFEALVRDISVAELLLQRDEVPSDVDIKVAELAKTADDRSDANIQRILEHTKSKRVGSIPKADLAIMLVVMTELQDGLDLPVALAEADKLADAFGGTDSSPDFVHAILSKSQVE